MRRPCERAAGCEGSKMRALLAILTLLLLPAGAPAAAPDSRPPVFAEQPQPPPPDYAQAANWASRPGAEGPAQRVPIGASPRAAAPRADVFYVHPTTFSSSAAWNQRLDDAATNAWTDESVIARQASVFSGCCRIFAPRYRQASSLAFAHMAGDGARAYALAYEDVLRAFDQYLARDNGGRPFILAGHSQGGLHVASLLRDRIDGKPLARRMVAAYVLGYGLSAGELGTRLPTLKACVFATDSGCVVGWNSFLDGSDVSAFVARSEERFIAANGEGPGKTLLCTNPLRFGPRPQAALGSLMGESDKMRLMFDAVDARCSGGVLFVRPDPALELDPLPGGNMHYHDVALFYGDLRADAVRRGAAFQTRTARRGR